MSRDVVTLPKEMSLRAAAHMLSLHRISGAPVVDADGRCIGVVSATDFMRLAEKGEPAAPPEATSDWNCAWQMVDVEELPVAQVGGHMTRDPVMVSPQTTIVALARLMLDAHIHRVVVTDEEQRPIGVVSTTDLLAAIARADAAGAPAAERASYEDPASAGLRLGQWRRQTARPSES
jgi:CBS domain-containing protein